LILNDVRGQAAKLVAENYSMIVKMIRRISRVKRHIIAASLLATIFFSACDIERRKSDAELGLNPQQAAGRKIYDSFCDRCHEPYSTRGKKGPGLKGIFKHPYLSLSGLPANDERVTEIIRIGRNEMPAYGQRLNPDEMQELMAYLHTL
jgi:mono/diheme cytochrome c family protein